MNYPIEHISYSSLNTFYNCRECWRRKYILKEPEPEHDYFVEGKHIHEQVHNYHVGETYDKKLLEPYTAKYSVDDREYSEVKFKLFLMGFSLPFLGFIDSVNLTQVKVKDLKYAVSAPKLEKNMQGILYTLAFKKIYQDIPTFVIQHWNKKTNKIKDHGCQYGKEDFDWFKGKVYDFLKEIRDPDGMFITKKPGHAWHLYNDCSLI